MGSFLNLGLPLLSHEIPRVLNSLAIWIVIIDAVCDFTRYAGNSFKMRKYYNEDGYIAMALDFVVLLVGLEIIRNLTGITFLQGLDIFIMNIVFLIAVCSIVNTILLNTSKFDYSKIINNENTYEQTMQTIRTKRKMGSIGLIASCILLRILMSLYPKEILFILLIVVGVFIFTRMQFNYVSGEMRKYLKRDRSNLQENLK